MFKNSLSDTLCHVLIKTITKTILQISQKKVWVAFAFSHTYQPKTFT